jgi:hypothetical protein
VAYRQGRAAVVTPADERLELRVSPSLKARLKDAAKADHRSLTSFVVATLESALSASETREGDWDKQGAIMEQAMKPAHAKAAKGTGRMCRTCVQNGPPKARPCAKCGHQR